VDHIDDLSSRLHDARNDIAAVEALFSAHASSGFLADFVAHHAVAIARDSNHFLAGITSQDSICLINTPSFDYTIRFGRPVGAVQPHPHKWTASTQLIKFQIPGTGSARIFEVPSSAQIDAFEPGVPLRIAKTFRLEDCVDIVKVGPREIFDICESFRPQLAEVLTIRSDAVGLIWTFGPDLISVFAEDSTARSSRLQNVLDLAYAAGHRVPEKVYQCALAQDNPQVRLSAIRSMLRNGHERAFWELHMAIVSTSKALAAGASEILNSMIGSRVG